MAGTARNPTEPIGTPPPPERTPEPTVLADADVDNKTVFDLSKPNPFDRPFTWGIAEFTLPKGAIVTTLEWDEYSDGLRHQLLTIKNGESVLEFDVTIGVLVKYEVEAVDAAEFATMRDALEAAR